MIGSHYNRHKENVIDIFEAYKEKRGNQNDGRNINFLENRIEALKNGKYILAVAGEVKAGKSTFLNALLGAEILPADVLQATSAIVEIYKSQKSFLKVKYADGHEEKISDDILTANVDEAVEKLRHICSVGDKFREIPTTLLDEYIIKSEGIIEITDDLISTWQSRAGVDLAGKKDLIKQYVNGHTKEKIPVEIEFGYPLKWEFDELRIVDSPGVNALGGVQDVSFQFFNDANAILFVHPIKPVESESFRKFVNIIVTVRSRETLFLVLTHAGLHPDNDVERLHEEAIRLYQDTIPKERILVVDSLLKLIHDDLNKGRTLKEIKDSSPRKRHIISAFKDKAEEENKEYLPAFLEYSRFEKMFEAIDTFTMQAPNLQLRELLDSIKQGYDDQTCQYEDKLALLGTKKRNPQEFEDEINRIQQALAKYKNLIYKTEEMRHIHMDRSSEWNERIGNLKAKYCEAIAQSASADYVRKHCSDAENEVEDLINLFSRFITDKLSKKLEEMGKTFKSEHKITLPKVDLKAIEENAKKAAFRTENIYEDQTHMKTETRWYTLWLYEHKVEVTKKVKTGENQVYDETVYLRNFKDHFYGEFDSLVDALPGKISEISQLHLASFKKEIDDVIEGRKKALDEEKGEKRSNDELITEEERTLAKKNELQPELRRIEEVLEDLR